MKQLIDAFVIPKVNDVPNVCHQLWDMSTKLRIWMTSKQKDLMKLSNAVGKKHNGSEVIMPLDSRIKSTFPTCKRLKYIAVYGDCDFWMYFFLPYLEDVTIDEVMYHFLWLCERYGGNDFGGFLEQLKDDDYDMNSMSFNNLMEIHRHLEELRDMLPSVMRQSANHSYSRWYQELSRESLNKK